MAASCRRSRRSFPSSTAAFSTATGCSRRCAWRAASRFAGRSISNGWGGGGVFSVFARGFLYGDGLFETMRVARGKPFRWPQHLERLERGAAFLKLNLPFAPDKLRRWAHQLIVQNQMPESVLRLTLSRGPGPRGYSPKSAPIGRAHV